MAITAPSLAPSLVARAAAADASLFRPGQILDALVLGKTPDGLTTLKIGDALVNAQLPQSLPQGSTLRLLVSMSGAAPQLTILAQALPAQPTVAPVLPLPVIVQTGPGAAGPPAQTALVQPVASPAAAPSGPTPPPSMVPPAATHPSAPMPVGQDRAPSPETVRVAVASVPAAAAKTQPTAALQPAVIGESRRAVAATGAPPVSASASGSPAAVAPNVPLASGGTPGAQAAVISVPAVAVGGAAPSPVPGRVTALPAAPIPSAPAVSSAANVVESPGAPLPAAISAPATVVGDPPIRPTAATVTAAPTSAVLTAATEPDLGNPLLVAQGAARPQATMADLPRVSLQSSGAMPAASTGATLPATPQIALTQMLPDALARQNSMAPLFIALAGALTKPSALPEPIVRAALQLLAQRVALLPGGPTADLLVSAMAKSGIALEASLAKGVVPPTDLKAALVGLKAAAAAWLGGHPAPVTPLRQAAPPLRGMPPRAAANDAPPLPDTPREAARAVHGQTDSALSRVKLMQLASLPDADAPRAQPQELRMELPFLIGSELVMAQFQIFRDGGRRKAESKRGWTMRFAMNLSGSGEVGAEVGLFGKGVSVALWAGEPEMAERLAAALPDLSRGLAALGLDPGSIRVRNAPPEPVPPVSGQLLDSVR